MTAITLSVPDSIPQVELLAWGSSRHKLPRDRAKDHVCLCSNHSNTFRLQQPQLMMVTTATAWRLSLCWYEGATLLNSLCRSAALLIMGAGGGGKIIRDEQQPRFSSWILLIHNGIGKPLLHSEHLMRWPLAGRRRKCGGNCRDAVQNQSHG